MSAALIDRRIDRFLRRWAFVSPANIDRFAERSAESLGLKPPPRLASEILRELGVEVRRESLPPGLHAVWSVDEGVYTIRLSPFLGAARANFTLWHEWFEVMAARPAFPTRLSEWRRERLADRYAAVLTMPAFAVARSLQEFAACGDKADVMAARFGISVAAMRRRIRELAPVYPAGPEGGDTVPACSAGLADQRDRVKMTIVDWPE